ncbi:protein-L-isoaspartate O-methyltransferase [Biscogniauxia sp. FL1348]|nr:protein-L-isoaspartate O-methyltransferase [Biscogniauxia sp. FL1348]
MFLPPYLTLCKKQLFSCKPIPPSPLHHHKYPFSGPSATIITKRLIAMAWRSSGSSNASLVENLWHNRLITQPAVKEAFLRVDRAHYAPSSAYHDSPQYIGHDATISAPHMHASAVESLLPFLLPPEQEEGGGGGAGRRRRVLDIGSGSGYLTHVLAELVGKGGIVVGLEHITPLRDLGEANMRKSAQGRALLDEGRVRFRVGDGRRGWVEPDEGGGGEGGWDAIHVGAAAAELHEELVGQLRRPGRMFIPVEDSRGEQFIWTVDKDADGKVVKKKLYGVRYVPLTDAPRA